MEAPEYVHVCVLRHLTSGGKIGVAYLNMFTCFCIEALDIWWQSVMCSILICSHACFCVEAPDTSGVKLEVQHLDMLTCLCMGLPDI